MIVLTQASNTRLQPTLTGYDGRQIRFRVWWVRDYGAMSAGNWWRWFSARKPWNPTGGMPEWVYVRRAVPPARAATRCRARAAGATA